MAPPGDWPPCGRPRRFPAKSDRPMNTLNHLALYSIALVMVLPLYSLAILTAAVSRSAAWRLLVCWDRLFLKLFGVDVTIEYDDPAIKNAAGGLLVGLNQESLLDPIIGRAVSHTVYKSIFNLEFALIPFVGWVAWIFGWVIVRQWPKQARRQLDKAAANIRNGGIVFLSIEGRRSKDGSLSPYKKGPAVLAISAQTVIVPVIIYGSRDCLPYGEWKIRPGTVTVKVLKEIPARGLRYEDRDALVRHLHQLAERNLTAPVSSEGQSAIHKEKTV